MYHNGQSERAFKKAVAERYDRSQYLLTDKLPMFIIKEKEQIEKIFPEQLQKCGVEYFDNYLLHSLTPGSYKRVQDFHAFEFCQKMKEQGKIKSLGFSFHATPQLLETILKEHHEETEFVQLQINYLDWEDESIRARECYEIARSYGKPIIVMEPIKGGALSGLSAKAAAKINESDHQMSFAEHALRFVDSLDGVMMTLSGMSNIEQLEQNTSFFDRIPPMTQAEMQNLLQVAEIIRNTITVPCTSCRYCTEGCPKGIDIPKIFSIYNDLKRFDRPQRLEADMHYKNLIQKSGRAGDCMACGKCEKVCPQSLEISRLLKDVSSIMD
jgi:predicted aldo/keto reductase-like oxidoreductase